MIRKLGENRCHGGVWRRYQHTSRKLRCEMTFSVYHCEGNFGADQSESEANLVAGRNDFNVGSADRQPDNKNPSPVLLWLSGLTCTDQNFVQKAHAEFTANALGITLIVPDTSPRGLVFDGVKDSYDLGLGAGFYLDATEPPWCENFRMESYLIRELLPLVESDLGLSLSRLGISGHSMGGHGAITLALKYPDLFQSVSAFSPICAPTQCPWGQKAFAAYLGADDFQETALPSAPDIADRSGLTETQIRHQRWRMHDSCALIESGRRVSHLLVEQGSDDEFLETQLLPGYLVNACKAAEIPLDLSIQQGYDHSYFFISTFIDKHLRYHERILSSLA